MNKMYLESQHVNDTMLADDLLQAEKRKDRKRALKLRRYRMKIAALRRCGYLNTDEETRTWT